MSSPSSRLLNVITLNKTATSKLSTIFKRNPPIHVDEIFNTSDLEQLATKFKQNFTAVQAFRSRNDVYHFTIGRLALAKRHDLIEDILEHQKRFPEITQEEFVIRIINMFGNVGMFDHARKVFDEMPDLNCTRTVLSFNALLNAGVKTKRVDEIRKIFKQGPLLLSIKFDVVSYNTMIHGLCEMGLINEALSMLDEMKINGLDPNVGTFNALLNGFYRERGFLGGEKIWTMMEKYNVARDIQSHNLTLQALINDGELSTAVILFDVLASEGLKPNLVTFNVFIKGLCDHGDVNDAKKWYNAMLEYGYVPTRTTFTALIPKLRVNGDIELAFDVCKKMFKRKIVVDEALMQGLVDELVNRKMIKEAVQLVELGKSNNYVQYDLSLPRIQLPSS